MLSLIVAISENNAIGHNGDLLCHLAADLKHFKQLTTGHSVLMGRKTYFSLPHRPLPNRRNIVITQQTNLDLSGAERAASVEEAIAMVKGEQEAFVIGGGSIYRQMLPFADKLYITHIRHTWHNADTFFPDIEPTVWQRVAIEEMPAGEKDDYAFAFAEYVRISR
ncbi:MAG: dihydrofolate reductase [Paludibacteraceae bacterium]|nr:dihydrofolate reductase [Paludibacteraceae bacterium]